MFWCDCLHICLHKNQSLFWIVLVRMPVPLPTQIESSMFWIVLIRVSVFLTSRIVWAAISQMFAHYMESWKSWYLQAAAMANPPCFETPPPAPRPRTPPSPSQQWAQNAQIGWKGKVSPSVRSCSSCSRPKFLAHDCLMQSWPAGNTSENWSRNASDTSPIWWWEL